MVTQETHLFHDTIRTNLLYARLDASQAEIEAAARPPTFMILLWVCPIATIPSSASAATA